MRQEEVSVQEEEKSVGEPERVLELTENPMPDVFMSSMDLSKVPE